MLCYIHKAYSFPEHSDMMKNSETLRKWLRLAAHSGSIEEFKELISESADGEIEKRKYCIRLIRDRETCITDCIFYRGHSPGLSALPLLHLSEVYSHPSSALHWSTPDSEIFLC